MRSGKDMRPAKNVWARGRLNKDRENEVRRQKSEDRSQKTDDRRHFIDLKLTFMNHLEVTPRHEMICSAVILSSVICYLSSALFLVFIKLNQQFFGNQGRHFIVMRKRHAVDPSAAGHGG